MIRKFLGGFAACAGLVGLLALNGCSSGNVEVVDLNKVLDVFQATLTELDGVDESVTASSVTGTSPDNGAETPNATDPGAAKEEPAKQEEKEEHTTKFLTLFAKKLNEAKVSANPVGVEFAQSGTIKGFTDTNSNNTRDSGEKDLFTLDIDAANSRVVASDGTYYRDHRYRPRFGFFSGYMIGSMMNRNRSYYSGSRAAMKPDFSKKTMSPKSYHSSAVTKARTAARSSGARSRSGSRGMSFGK